MVRVYHLRFFFFGLVFVFVVSYVLIEAIWVVFFLPVGVEATIWVILLHIFPKLCNSQCDRVAYSQFSYRELSLVQAT
jgi:hypothetical protein